MTISATPNSSIRNVSDRSRVTKNPKACEECRRRKQKCDGKTPCDLCTKRNSQCSYRSYIRHRPGRTSTTTTGGASEKPSDGGPPGQSSIAVPGTDGQDPAADDPPRSMPPRLSIFNNIRATQHTPRGMTEVFYGASSPYSVLQHLDAHLPVQGAPAVHPSPEGQQVQDGDRSIRSYNYQTIVFDRLNEPTPCMKDFDSTSYASAKIALRNYLVTAHPRLPFLDSTKLCTDFEKLYNNNGAVQIAIADRAVVIAALGLGAFPLTDLACRELFLVKARAEAVTVMYDINTEAVQAMLLLAQLEFEAGRPNICYLHLGAAIRKAFAAGVHRSDSPLSKQTMWTLYCCESSICFILGKQHCLDDKDVAFPHAEDVSHMAYFVRLYVIIRSAHRIYSLDGTVAADYNAAMSVLQQLHNFSKLLKQDTCLEIGGQLYRLTGDDLAWQISFSYSYHATNLLLFRPFLLLCLELKRRGIKDISECNGDMEMAVLLEAAGRSVSAAKDIVAFCDSLFSLQIGIEGLYSHGFYLECACLVLALAAVHHNSQLSAECLEVLRTGLRLLRQLGSHQPVGSTIAAVEEMIARLQTLSSRAGSDAVHAIDSDTHAAAQAIGASGHLNVAGPSMAYVPALDPFDFAATPATWDSGVSLDDIWSMMDWNAGFSSDFNPGIMPGM